jgi:rhamnulokinase
VPQRELYERTGIQLMPINTVHELAAMVAEADPVLAAADRLLLIPDLFHYWLCGSRSSELTNATTTQCFEARTGTWADDLLERIGIPTQLFPDVVRPGTRLGPVTDAESGALDATVVAAATHDTGSAVAGTPLEGDRSAFLSVGTWSLVGVESTTPSVGDAAYRANVTNEGGVDGTFRVLCNVTGLWLLQELQRTWAAAGADHSPAELVARARSAPALRSLVDPNDPLFAPPGDMPARIAEYCERTGQPRPEDPGAVVRCIFESLALKHAETVDLLADVTGRRLEQLHVVGGGARNELLCEWTAAAAGRPVYAGPAEATLVGNLLVQARALGELSSLAEARDVVRRSFSSRTYEPETSEAWREARERFAALTRARVEVTT